MQPTRISVLLSGVCALMLSMGLARYSFPPMIPIMHDEMGVSESLAGWLAGWNYIGYMAGLFIVWLISDLRAKDFFYRYGMIVAVLGIALMAAHENRVVWYASRFFTGVASAGGFMLGTGLVLNWLLHNGHEDELGIHFSGIGLGIVCAALVVDATGLDSALTVGWRWQWVALAGVGALLAVPALFLLPAPGEKEIEMSRESAVVAAGNEPSARWLWLMQIAYVCAGFSNTVNVTFTSLITELQPLPGLGSFMWLVVGLSAAPAPFIWDRFARRYGSMDMLKAAFALAVVGNITLALTFSFISTLIAAILIGFTFMGIVSLTLSTVARNYGPRATQIMARLTVGYCIAQILSPIFSGTVAEMTGGFGISLTVSSSIMVVGLICLLMIRNESQKLQRPGGGPGAGTGSGSGSTSGSDVPATV
ncbi:MAG: YbfB/YjiJ family MFS transporter [Pseudomonadota bacterium]